jgi:hypothetical protein
MQTKNISPLKFNWLVLSSMIIVLGVLPFFAQAAPLRLLASNPRYFTVDGTTAVYLTGSHDHNVVLDGDNPTQAMDWDAYVNWLKNHNHNFIRFWTWYGPSTTPLPWVCPSGAPPDCSQFDLGAFDVGNLNSPRTDAPHYFERLRARAISAGQQGIYVSVMLFESWVVQNLQGSSGWDFNPFAVGRNVNGVSADINGDGYGLEIYTLPSNPAYASDGAAQQMIDRINQLQKAYVRQIIEVYPIVKTKISIA